MEIPVVRVAGISAASRESVAADDTGIVFTAGAGAVHVQIDPSGALRSPQFFHLPRKRLLANANQRFPWDRQPGPVMIGETCAEEAKAKAKDKVNSASCVVASPLAVAVGETGYLPRVIVYSKTAQPLAVIQEHQFGIQNLRFSRTGSYLATLGTPNDGYLYIWQIDMDAVSSQMGSGLSLHSSNRCISQVNDIQWISDNQLVTVGVRHIRIWTVETGAGNNGVLAGRNVVLGTQADSTFVCAVRLGGEMTGLTGAPQSPGGISPFLVATQSGTILRVGPGISVVLQVEMTVRCMDVKDGVLIVAGERVRKYNLENYEELDSPVPVTGIKSLAVGNELVYLTTSGLVLESGVQLHDPLDEQVVGIRGFNDEFVSWGGRSIGFWTDKLERRDQKQLDFEIAVLHTGAHTVAGGVEGQLYIDGQTFNAHAGPVSDVDGVADFVVSAGRDRCLQIWRKKADEWDLQTLPLLGPLTKARIVNDETIITVVGNKSLQIHKLVDGDFVTGKTVSSKVLILDLAVADGTVTVSTSDRQIQVIDADGEQLAMFRPLDVQGEPIALLHIALTRVEGAQYLVAAAADKSVCVYSHPQGQLLAAEWAHSAPIKGIAVCGDRLVSYGDLIVERQLVKEPERPASPVRPLSPIRSVRPPSPVRRPASPVRTTTSLPARSLSPVRAAQSTTPTRARSPSPRRASPAPAPAPARTSPRPAPPPLRLSTNGPKLATRPGVVEALEQALEAYLCSDQVAPQLQPLLTKALAKSGSQDAAFTALADGISDEIMEYVRRKLR